MRAFFSSRVAPRYLNRLLSEIGGIVGVTAEAEPPGVAPGGAPAGAPGGVPGSQFCDRAPSTPSLSPLLLSSSSCSPVIFGGLLDQWMDHFTPPPRRGP